MRDFIYHTLAPRISPMVYIMMGVSVIIGLFFLTGLVDASNSVLFVAGTVVDTHIWGAFLFCGALTAELGMIAHSKKIVRLGTLVTFMAWVFACIGLALSGNLYALLTLGLFHLLFQGYVYLATSFDLLARKPV